MDKPTPRARQTWEVGAKPALSFHLTISRDKPSQEGNTSAKPTKSDSVTSPSQAKLHGEATAKLNLAQDWVSPIQTQGAQFIAKLDVSESKQYDKPVFRLYLLRDSLLCCVIESIDNNCTV